MHPLLLISVFFFAQPRTIGKPQLKTAIQWDKIWAGGRGMVSQFGGPLVSDVLVWEDRG